MSTVGSLGEFALIERIQRIAGRAGALRGAGVVLGIGDDAALMRTPPGHELVVSTDAAVEDVHFRWRMQSARTVGRRAAVAALSDLAAMGARPLGLTFALALPKALPLAQLDGLAAGLTREAASYACPLVGGNLTRSTKTALTLTVLGSVPRGRALRRKARVGDRIFATGSFGRSALEVALAQQGRGRVRHVPTPRIRAGMALLRMSEVRGCIDVSDGLEADLAHLLGPKLHLPLDPSRIPKPRGFKALCERAGLDPDTLSLTGGEDYELVFSMAPRGPGEAVLARRLGVAVRELGVARRGAPSAPPGGWRHL